ncbi:MAG: hypothetical protein KAV41_03275 [Candidatus Pacebacteria bacterium]|nr:hypothetical protein [Candidatus Paceibacterota bacterium]
MDNSQPKCPECGSELEPIYYRPQFLLNFEQWSAVRAGDYFCPNRECPGIRKVAAHIDKKGRCCFFEEELKGANHK